MPGRIDFALLEASLFQRPRARVDIVGVRCVYAHDDGVCVSAFTPDGSDRMSYIEVTPAPKTMFDPGNIAQLVAEAALGEQMNSPYELVLVSLDDALTAQVVQGTRDVVFKGRNYLFRIHATPHNARLYPPTDLALTVGAQKAFALGLESACAGYEHFHRVV